MQHTSNSPWRTPGDHHKPQYSLSHTISMVNLHEEPAWFNRGPSSPTASSVSTSTSRSATPTTTNNNPWSNVMMSPNSVASSKSPRVSPNHSPPRTTPYTSRSTTPTPIAPQPLRPIKPMAGFVPLSPPASVVGDPYQTSEYPTPSSSTFPGSPNPYRQPVAPLTPLVHGFINTSALSSQGQSLSGWFYDLCRKQGWDAGQIKRIWQWTLSNPRLAILLYVCDDVASWRQASFFDLRDESLPFPEDRLQGIVANARKVVDEQWRATAKEMPLNGSHVDFVARETVPLLSEGFIRISKNSEKSVDQVRLLGGSDDRVLVRKRFVTTRPSQKAALLDQISRFRQLDHKNIARLLCSYAQPSHVGIVVEKAQCSLDDYLAMPGCDPSRSRLLVDWMYDLASALEYLHAHSICHRAIRPRKILVHNSHILLAPFELGTTTGTLSPATPAPPSRPDTLSASLSDQSYIYAAPEAIVSRAKRPADVFALGCVFLAVLTVAQNQSLAAFTQYRAGSTHDASFHAHLDRVGSWRTRLVASTNAGLRAGATGSGRRLRQLRAEAEWLGIVERMVAARPKERVKMSVIMGSVGTGKVAGGRRRSLDGGGYSGQALGGGMGDGEAVKMRRGSPPRRPELSVFDGYFSQQSRKLDPAGGW
ncbi:kinase-like domain-containing protein [Boeremia exigua]|uniref:kinase-like domain-containing protein n=1 Tax=Boeremia exigua TaxID=749465 RepID=UPI001E8EBDB1|nr:kinase-like domain-containing protein [Boeremia exigua]KAH6629534.1 kinase-like domain-containing protein [Boeremia exigua]